MKIIVKQILCILLIISGLHIKAQGCLEADIILMADLSGSIKGNEGFVADAYDVFVERFELAEHGIRIGAYVFSDKVYMISGITDQKQYLLKATEIIRNNPYGTTTNLTGAMDVAYTEYVAKWRKNSRRILILISDGNADYKNNFLRSVKRLKDELGVEVCGIYVNTFEGRKKRMASISEPYCYVVSNYEELANILEKLNICG